MNSTQRTERERRLAAALRVNLARRKQQARAVERHKEHDRDRQPSDRPSPSPAGLAHSGVAEPEDDVTS